MTNSFLKPQQQAASKEWDAAAYHYYSAIQYQLAEATLKRYDFRGDERVLDVGCGDGKITALIARRVAQGSVIGVDKSESMIAFAQQHFQESNLIFELQDAAALPYEEEFDVVFSFNCLHWVHDQQAALNGISRSLSHSGLLFAVLLAALNFAPAIQTAIKKEQWRGFFPVYKALARAYRASEYEPLLLQANLTPLFIRERVATMVFAEREQLVQWLKPILSAVQQLPIECRDLFMDDVVDAFFDIYPLALQSSGAVYMPLPVLEVGARKHP